MKRDLIGTKLNAKPLSEQGALMRNDSRIGNGSNLNRSLYIQAGCRVIAPPLPRIYCGRIYKRASARVARCGGERACNAAPLSFIIPVYTIPGDSFTTIRAAGASPER